MKRKVLTLIIIGFLASSIAGCGKETPDSPDTPNIPMTREDAEYTYGEDIGMYTNENLPDEYAEDDLDKDGLNNREEASLGTNIYRADTDEDGISDYEEAKTTKTSPTQWSSRDDGVSDLEWVIKAAKVTEGYTETDISGFTVYIKSSEDLMWVISKVSTNAFDGLETITEAYQIKNFTGKMALDCSKMPQTAYEHIAIYKISNGKAEKAVTTVEESMISFEVTVGDIFVAVYMGG